jgi:hypothetical protein
MGQEEMRAGFCCVHVIETDDLGNANLVEKTILNYNLNKLDGRVWIGLI